MSVAPGDHVVLPDGRDGTVLSVEGAPAYATVAVAGADGRRDNVGCAVDALLKPEPVKGPSTGSGQSAVSHANLLLQGGGPTQ